MRPVLLSVLVACAPPAGTSDADLPDDDGLTDTEPVPADTDVPDTDVPDTEDTDASDTDPPGDCVPTLAPGDHALTLDHEGRSRRALVHVPIDLAASPPLVLNFHGWLFDPEDQRSRSRMNPHADTHGYVVAYPAGIDNSWSGGACCGTAVSEGIDDVGFVRKLAARLQDELCVDAQRIYATGFSNGGFLAHRLACEASDLIAAAAPVSSLMTLDPATCDRDHVAPLIHLHGTTDIVVPYIGNPLFDYPPFGDSVAVWTDFHGCSDPVRQDLPRGHCDDYTTCTSGAELRFCTLERWGHEWPGGASPLPANDAIWSFLSRFTRDAP